MWEIIKEKLSELKCEKFIHYKLFLKIDEIFSDVFVENKNCSVLPKLSIELLDFVNDVLLIKKLKVKNRLVKAEIRYVFQDEFIKYTLYCDYDFKCSVVELLEVCFLKRRL